MKLSRPLTGLALAASVALSGAESTATAQEASRYVALGDSYSAGVGSQDSYDNDCLRADTSYPTLWLRTHNFQEFAFAACSGATTSDVLNQQIRTLGPSDTLVTITIGGNDVGFTNVLTACLVAGDEACKAAVEQAVAVVNGQLPERLANVFSAIRQAAPRAHVVVLSYPHLFEPTEPCSATTISNQSRASINAGIDGLDAVLETQAGQAGFSFADVRPRFAGHGVCTQGVPWIQSLAFPITNSFHPAGAGYAQGYLPALSEVAD